MADHVCRWGTQHTVREDGLEVVCKNCERPLPWREVFRRIDAAERLSAEDAKVLLGDYPETYKENMDAVESLRAYAEVREGNKCTCEDDYEEHICPLAEAVHDDSEVVCHCCAYCTDQCAQEI